MVEYLHRRINKVELDMLLPAAKLGMQVATVATISDIQRSNIYYKMNEAEGGSRKVPIYSI